jgi:subtilase family serine protease
MAQAVAPSVQVVNRIDESSLVTLKGNTHPFANAKNDRGRVSPDLPMTDLILVLSRSPQQQADFERFVASQYDPDSPNFHKWLKPEEVGLDFGLSPADIATISDWLAGHGFSINEVSRDRMSIRFSGTAAQVESTFHTEIHNLEVKGVQHLGNMSDPRIPAGLAPAVVGVKSLHNFFARPMHRTGSQVTRNSSTGRWQRSVAPVADSTRAPEAKQASPKPQFGVNVPASGSNDAYLVEDVSPYDFATIYNVLPLWNAGSPIDGTGQTIAIAGTSDICLGQSDANCLNTSGGYNNDVSAFRGAFGLPAYTAANQPNVVSGNSQPLTVCATTDTTQPCNIEDMIENSLDVEWSGSIAKGANIVLVASYPASASDDNLYDSESYIVNNQTASIMSVSYGLCELFNGTAGNVQYYNLWQTASSEGIAVFVASGDGAAAECDDGGDAVGNPYSAQYGVAVNGLASTPFNTAVGGTDFNWCPLASTTACAAAHYWNTSNAATGASAKGYVPEVPWNDTCANPLTLAFLQQQATADQYTAFTDTEGACNFAYNFGSQNTSPFVDTVGGGGGASDCVSNDGNDVSSCDSSITSTGSSNGSITLVADGWPKPSWQAGVPGIPGDGVRDLPDLSFFASDGFVSYSSYLICVSAVGDCTYSTTTEPTAQEVGGTSASTPAMAGVMALINQKAGEAQGSPNSELYKLAAAQNYSNCSAENATTGNGCLFNDIDSETIAVPCDYGAEEGNPGQTGIQSPDCSVIHTGDLVGILPGYSAAAGYDQATGLGSLNVANVVNAWPAASATGKATVTVTPAQSSLGAGSPLSVAVTVAASSSGTTPSGKVTLLGGGYSSGAQALSSGAYTFNISANSLSAGTDVLTVSYSGDTTYEAATGSATVTVAAAAGSGAATVTVIPAQTTLSAGSTLSVAVAVTGSSSGATPTGTVTLSGGGYTSAADALALGTYTFTIPANSLAAGSDALTVSYSGDTNFAAATGTATVTVTSGTSTGTFTLSATTPAAVAPGTSATSTITVSTADSYTGTASLTCALTNSPSGAVDVPSCSLSPTTVSLSSTSTSGTVSATVATTAATTSQLARPKRHGAGREWMGGAVLALLIFFGIPARRRAWRSMAGAVVLLVALASLVGCGDFWEAPAGNTAGGTTAGTYTFTVTGTGDPAVSTAVTTTFVVTVN